MRLLYFSRDYTTHDHRFLTSLAGTEHQVYFLQLERRGATLEDRALPPEVHMVHWRGGRGPFEFRHLPHLLFQLKGLIRKIKPDLIHAGPIQTAGLLVALSGFHPFVSVSWGYDLLRDADRGRLWRWATRFTLGRSDALVGDCDTVRMKALGFGFPTGRMVTFPYGVDIKHFSPAAEQEGQNSSGLRRRLGWENGFILLSTRGWEPGYGVDELARAFVHAARQRSDLRLLLLGTGSQAQLLRRIFLQGGMLDRVHFGGQVGQEKLPHYFRTADLYVTASHSDGTSISLLEALACGRPALVSDIPGNQEWVSPGKHGWMFTVGDVAAMGAAILQAIDKREDLRQMGQAARALAEDRADWQKNFQSLFKAYKIAQEYAKLG